MPDQTVRDDLPSGTEGLGESARGELPGRVEDSRAVLDTLPVVIGYYGTDLRIRLANRTYLEFFGLTLDEVLGRHISEVIGPQLYGANRAHIDGVLAGEPQLFARGQTSAAIAERLFVTEGTIKWHVKQILAKTNSATRAEAVARVLGTPQ